MAELAMNETLQDEILSQVDSQIGWITLNRPKALNSLSLNMIRQLTILLNKWADDPDIKAVVVQGEGEKAFCAGGDVRAAYEAKTQGLTDHIDLFFREEYTLNTLIHEYPKPYIAIIDGIAMGGGLGISVNSPHTVVTEKAYMAMPETGIGFFPDVGATWFLSKAPDSVGLFLAATGHRFQGEDALYAGIVNYYTPSQSLPSLLNDLKASDDVTRVLKQFKKQPPTGYLETHAEEISHHFDRPSIHAILEGLKTSDTPFAQETRKALFSKSPLSVHVAFAQLQNLDPKLTFRDMMKREFRISQHFMKGHDFFEGVRALLVDKDQNPQWAPKTFDDVTEEQVQAYFKELGGMELQW